MTDVVDGKRVHRGDPRAEELDSLRLALATFAMQLDAFEAGLKIRRGQTQKIATAADPAPDAATVADVPQAKPDRACRHSRRTAGIADNARPRSIAVR